MTARPALDAESWRWIRRLAVEQLGHLDRFGDQVRVPPGMREHLERIAAVAESVVSSSPVDVDLGDGVSMTRTQAAEVLGVSTSTVDRWIRTGRLTARHVGRAVVVVEVPRAA